MPSVMMHYKAILEYFRLFHATTFSHLAQESSQEVGRQWGDKARLLTLYRNNYFLHIICYSDMLWQA